MVSPVIAGQRLSQYVAQTAAELGFLRGVWLDASLRLTWLEDVVTRWDAGATQPAPARLADGIKVEGVSFHYPGTDRLSLEDVNVTLPAGSVVAIVGENGAGKSTLVKLLAKMYEPTSGRILIGGTELRRVAAADWRDRLAGAFQDFFRFEFRARHTVGVGDVPRLDDQPAVATAVTRAGADDVVGCDTSCLLHLRGRAEHEGRALRTRHLVEVLAAALPGAGPDTDTGSNAVAGSPRDEGA